MELGGRAAPLDGVVLTRLLARLAVGLALSLLALSAALGQVEAAGRYQSLYRELDRELAAFESRVPRAASDLRPIRAANWTSVSCDAGEAALAEPARERAQRELDALVLAGAQAIVLPICYPLLTPEYHDPRALLELYANLANEVRLRGRKLLVRHDVFPSAAASPGLVRYLAGVTRAQFDEQRYAEAKAILYAVQPDDFELVADPRAALGGLKITERDWSRYLERTIDRLRSEVVFDTRFGAGLWLGEELRYLDAWAKLPGLQFIDLRADSRGRGLALLDRLNVWPDRVRAIDAAKAVLVTDAWFEKQSPTLSASANDPNVLARDAYGFWAPLDERYLRALAQMARAKSVAQIGISRPAYLFAYLDYRDPLTFKANARALLELEAQRAEAAMAAGELTSTGRVFGGL